MAKDNRTLGNFNLEGIPMAPRGVPQIEVEFDLDSNGIVTVSAKDKGTGKEQKITITSGSGLTDEEIKRMQEDAEAHAEEDKKIKEKMDLKNEADSLIYQTEKTIKELGDKVSDSEKSECERYVSELKENLETDDIEVLKSKVENLKQCIYKMSEKLYQQQSPQGEQQGTADDVQYEVHND